MRILSIGIIFQRATFTETRALYVTNVVMCFTADQPGAAGY